MRNAVAGRNLTSRAVVRRRVRVRQATAAALVAAPVVALVLVAALSEPWKPSGEAHPLLVVAFMTAVGALGLAGMMLMRRGSRRAEFSRVARGGVSPAPPPAPRQRGGRQPPGRRSAVPRPSPGRGTGDRPPRY